MSTLNAPALSALINRLFTEADAAENGRWPSMRATDRSDYLKYYGLLKYQPLAVSRDTGTLLYMLARAIGARSIVEFGTSFGISTLHLAAALRDNGGGRLIGSEFEPSKIKRARENLPPPAACRIWWRFAKATRCKRSPAICLIVSILCCWMAPRRSIRRYCRCLRHACATARSLLPTTPTIARNTWPGSAPQIAVIFRSRSARMSSCPCD